MKKEPSIKFSILFSIFLDFSRFDVILIATKLKLRHLVGCNGHYLSLIVATPTDLKCFVDAGSTVPMSCVVVLISQSMPDLIWPKMSILKQWVNKIKIRYRIQTSGFKLIDTSSGSIFVKCVTSGYRRGRNLIDAKKNTKKNNLHYFLEPRIFGSHWIVSKLVSYLECATLTCRFNVAIFMRLTKTEPARLQ